MSEATSVCRRIALPSLPTVAKQLLQLARDPETSLSQIVQMVRIDPSLSAQVLLAVCSKSFGGHTNVITVEKACEILGPAVVQSLVLGFRIADESFDGSVISRDYVSYWRRSLATRNAAEIIAESVAPHLTSEYALCGLMLDIGTLAILSSAVHMNRDEPSTSMIPPALSRRIETGRENGIPVSSVAESVSIGARLLDEWGFPTSLVDAVRFHREDVERLLEQKEARHFPLRSAMALASAIGRSVIDPNEQLARNEAASLARRLMNWSDTKFNGVLRRVAEGLESSAALFRFDAIPKSADLIQEANEQLINVAICSHVSATQAAMRLQAVEREKSRLEFQTRHLKEQVLRDALTKVYSRQFFEEMLETEARRCRRCAEPLGIIFADVDHFKRINDTYGHQYGDEVLQKIAALFQESLRNSDVLARYGGEEFVILISQPTEKRLERLAERIRTRLEQAEFLHEGQRVKVTVSLGASIAVPGRNDVDLGRRLVSTADECLYEAKRGGRNRSVIRSLIDEKERNLMQMVQQHRFSRWLVAQRLLDIPSVSRALLECDNESLRLGDLAVQLGYLSSLQVEQIVVEQESTGERFGSTAVRLGHMNDEQLIHLLSLQQENPNRVTAAIIRLGLLNPDKATAALEDYLASKTPHRKRAPAQVCSV